MSRIAPTVIHCPGCGTPVTARLFESLNGDRIPAQVQAILDGEFEVTTCSGCGTRFRPEHHMLYAQFTARIWLVMYPVAARREYARLEGEVAHILERNFADAAVVVADALRGVRPRLVFGQHGLTEALRSARANIDPPLLECAKLLAFRHNLPALVQVGPSELVFESVNDTGELLFAVRAVPTGEQVGELRVASKLLGETRALLPELSRTHPLLFERPYISALRYLYPDLL